MNFPLFSPETMLRKRLLISAFLVSLTGLLALSLFVFIPRGEADNIHININSGDDDITMNCDVGGGCSVANPVILGYDGDDIYRNCFRYLDLALIGGAAEDVINANISFSSLGHAGPGSFIKTKISAIASDNAANCDIDPMPTLTDTNYNWNFTADWGAGETIFSAQFPDVINEIIDRPGWSSGNNIAIVFSDNDSNSGNTVSADDYDSAGPEAAPQLDLDYLALPEGTPEFNTTTLMLTVAAVIIAIFVIRLYVFKPEGAEQKMRKQ